MQANVGKGSPAYDIALNLAYEHHIDFVLTQEPWIHTDRTRRLTKKHPAYQCFTPVEEWEQRPRVITYIRKDPQLQAFRAQGSWPQNRDLLSVQVQAWGQQIEIINVYNAPPGSTNPGQAVQSLLSFTVPQRPVLIAGDFNLHYLDWQPNATNSSPTATLFANWAAQQNLTLTLEPGTPTRGESTLDLAWVSPELAGLGTSTNVEPALHSTSDHQTLCTVVQIYPQHRNATRGRF